MLKTLFLLQNIFPILIVNRYFNNFLYYFIKVGAVLLAGIWKPYFMFGKIFEKNKRYSFFHKFSQPTTCSKKIWPQLAQKLRWPMAAVSIRFLQKSNNMSKNVPYCIILTWAESWAESDYWQSIRISIFCQKFPIMIMVAKG